MAELSTAKGKEKKKVHYPLYNNYTPLKKPIDEIFLEVKNKGFIPPTLEMQPSFKRNDSKDYYKFHKAKEHDTKDCF